MKLSSLICIMLLLSWVGGCKFDENKSPSSKLLKSPSSLKCIQENLSQNEQFALSWIFRPKDPYDRVFRLSEATLSKQPYALMLGFGEDERDSVLNSKALFAFLQAAGTSTKSELKPSIYLDYSRAESFDLEAIQSEIQRIENGQAYKYRNSTRDSSVSVFIFSADKSNSKQIYSTVDAMLKKTSSPYVQDDFTPHPECRITRIRNGFNILRTYAIAGKNSGREQKARCTFTTLMLNFGLSNAQSIYDQAKVFSYKGTEMLPSLTQTGPLYTLYISTPNAAPSGGNICDVIDSLRTHETQLCLLRKTSIEQGKIKLTRENYDLITNQCKRHGINIEGVKHGNGR